MRVYDVGNKARVGFWCAAPDAETAKQIALAAGHAKKLENLDTTDITEKFSGEGAAEILNGERTGHLVRQLSGFSGTQLIASLKATGKPPVTKPPRWIFAEDAVQKK